MSVKYGKFEMPKKIFVDEEKGKENRARFVAEPFERGFGHTLGNSMRRMLLGCLEAPAIISVRIQGVPHEYMAIDGIIEDMTNIILNLKGALLRKLPTEEEGPRDCRAVTTVLEVTQEDLDAGKGSVSIKLKDIVKDGFFDLVNPDMHVFTVTAPMKKQIDLKVAFGRGYVASERIEIPGKTSDEIVLDAAFSPVKLVNYYVENTRVGQDTDFDRLILEVTTDGRVTPTEALTFAAQIGLAHFEVFDKIKTHTIVFEEGSSTKGESEDDLLDKLCLRIDEIELSVRSTNCLSGANIDTIAELVLIPERRMLEFKNFGKKSLQEIKAKLIEMGLGLGMDLSRYGITWENVKEKVRELNEEKKGRREVAKSEEN